MYVVKIVKLDSYRSNESISKVVWTSYENFGCFNLALARLKAAKKVGPMMDAALYRGKERLIGFYDHYIFRNKKEENYV